MGFIKKLMITVTLSAILLTTPVSADNNTKSHAPSTAEQTQTKELVFATIANSVPLQVAEAVLKEAYLRIGISFKTKNLQHPSPTAIYTKQGFDGVIARIDGFDLDIYNKVKIPVPITYAEITLLARKNIDISKNWYSLVGQNVGIIKGFTYAEIRTKQVKNKMRATNKEQLYAWLLSGKIDIAVITRKTAEQMIHADKQRDSIHVLPKDLEIMLLYHYLNKKYVHIVPKLTKVLKKMLLDGTIEKIRNEVIKKQDAVK